MTLFYGYAEDLLQLLQAPAILGDMCVSHGKTEFLKLKGKTSSLVRTCSERFARFAALLDRHPRKAFDYIVLIGIGDVQHLLHSISRRRRSAPTVFDRLVLYRSLAVASARYGTVSSLETCVLKKGYPSK